MTERYPGTTSRDRLTEFIPPWWVDVVQIVGCLGLLAVCIVALTGAMTWAAVTPWAFAALFMAWQAALTEVKARQRAEKRRVQAERMQAEIENAVLARFKYGTSALSGSSASGAR